MATKEGAALRWRRSSPEFQNSLPSCSKALMTITCSVWSQAATAPCLDTPRRSLLKNAGTSPITCARCRKNLPEKKPLQQNRELHGDIFPVCDCLVPGCVFWRDCICVGNFG